MADTVLVACKLPNGLHIENRTRDESAPNGWGAPERYTLNGSLHRLDENGSPIHAWEVSNTFGLTEVPKVFWDQWIAENKDAPYVRNGAIFAHPKDTRGQTKEMSDVTTGFEGRDPKNPMPGVEPMTDKPPA